MLDIRNLNFHYGGVQALYDVSMTIPAARITCVMGRNGVGKTTLLRNIMGLLSPSDGAVAMADRDITALPASRRARHGLALVPQGRMIFPKLTVEENLRVGLQARTDGLRRIPDHVFDLFPILKDFLKRLGGDLSGGQQQQLAIARAMVGGPKVLLLDEPTEGIQPNVIQQIGRVLRQFVEERREVLTAVQRIVAEHKVAVVLVEQYLDFVKEFGHRFYIMNRGQVVAAGDTGELTPQIVHQHLSV